MRTREHECDRACDKSRSTVLSEPTAAHKGLTGVAAPALDGLKVFSTEADPVLVSSFGVYVIQLRSCDEKSALGGLYVGSSWYPPSERLRQHNEGCETGSEALRRRCWRLRPELYLDLPWHWDRRKIVALERSRARRLAEAGFHVRCDGRIHSVAPEHRTPFTAEALERVSDQFDELARGLLTYARRPLAVEDIVRALRWTRSAPSVADLVEVPNEYIGRFSHVEERAVHDRASHILHPDIPDAPARKVSVRAEEGARSSDAWRASASS
jgi:hypothetical protein